MNDKVDYSEFVQSTQANQRRLMAEAAEVVMTRPIPGNDLTSKRAAMLPELKAEGDG